MLDPFQITKPVSPAHALAEEDVLKTKDALSALGHYQEPEGGSTPWPDTPMFEGLKTFQKDQGLKPDGLMKPGGPTEKALRASTGPLGIMPGEWEWKDKATKPKRAPRRPIDERPASWPQFPDPLRPLSLSGDPKTTPRQKGEDKSASNTPEKDETQVAAAQLLPLLPVLLDTGAAVATGDLLRRKTEDMMRDNGGKLPPLLPADPGPPTPPSERPDADLKPNREEFPATPPRGPEKHENPAETPEPTIEIYPAPRDTHLDTGIVERRGNETTRKELERIRNHFLAKGWAHEAGGRVKGTKRELPEYWIPSPAKDFDGDGRRGGNFSDLTFIMPNGRRVHIQSVDVDKNGKPTRRELDNAERIRKRTGESVILVPKNAQLKKHRTPPD